MPTLQTPTLSLAKTSLEPLAAPSLRVFSPDEAELISAFGQNVRVLLPAAHTRGAIAIVDVEVPAQEGPPPHIHHSEDETFVVTRGRFEFWLDGDCIEVGPGDIVYGPRDVPHTFRNISDEVATLQVIAVAAGFESFFRQCAQVWRSEDAMPQIMKIAQAHDLEFVDPQTTPKIGAPANGKTPRVVRAGNGEGTTILDGEALVAVSKSDSAGEFTMGWMDIMPGDGPTPHIHEVEDQIMMIESGTFVFSTGKTTVIAQAGDVAWLPRDLAHTFRCTSAQAGRLLYISLQNRLANSFPETAPVPPLHGLDSLPTVS